MIIDVKRQIKSHDYETRIYLIDLYSTLKYYPKSR